MQCPSKASFATAAAVTSERTKERHIHLISKSNKLIHLIAWNVYKINVINDKMDRWSVKSNHGEMYHSMQILALPGYWINACNPPFLSKMAIFWTVPNAENTWNNVPTSLYRCHSTTSQYVEHHREMRNKRFYRVKHIDRHSILHIFNGSKKYIAFRFFFLSIGT